MLENDLADRDDGWDALERVALALRRPEDLGPAVDAGVMAALRAEPLAAPHAAHATARPPAGPGVRAAEASLPTPFPAPRWGSAPRPAGRRGWLRVPRLLRWLVEPHTVRISPLGTLAAAGLTIAAVFGLRRDAERAGSDARLDRTGEFKVSATGEYPVPSSAVRAQGAAAPAPSGRAGAARDTIYVTRFMLIAPGARQVALVGDFNDWDQGATPLVRVAGNGMWTVEVPLEAGRYAYAFLVDGQHWVADPGAPRAVGDDFGRPSSVVTVRGSDT